MLYFSKAKIFTTLATFILSVLIVVVSNTCHVKYFRGIKLGLDLSGGSYLVLQPDMQVLKRDYYKHVADDIQNTLSSNNIAYSKLSLLGDTYYLKLQSNQNETEDLKKLKKLLVVKNEYLNLHKNGGQYIINVDPRGYVVATKDVLNQSIEILRRRVDEFGTNEPVIKLQGSQIVVELPGVKDTDKIKSIIGRTARISFHLVNAKATYNHTAGVPIGYKYLYDSAGKMRYAVSIEEQLTGSNLKKAALAFNRDNQPVISFSFDREGAQRFSTLTSSNIGKMLAIVLDNKVISAPVINTPITAGNGVIEGRFTVSEAQDLALLLQAGSLPVPLTVVAENTVGPSLGLQSIKAGLYSVIGGLILVFIYMAIFYRKLGLLANISLLANMFLTLAILSMVGATLTLPGIAGLILSIGMAVDSNILVYERFDFEVRKQRPALAMYNAFNKVYQTLLDSNLTTLFAAFFLFYFGSGPVKGFGVTLIIGILASMFSIFFTTRLLVNWFYLRNSR